MPPSPSEDGSPRAEPYYCPFCGEQDFVPVDEPGRYYCESCNRRFQVRMLGQGK